MTRKTAYVIRLVNDAVEESIDVEWSGKRYEGRSVFIPVNGVELSSSEKERYAILKLSPDDVEIKDVGWRFKYTVGVICDET